METDTECQHEWAAVTGYPETEPEYYICTECGIRSEVQDCPMCGHTDFKGKTPADVAAVTYFRLFFDEYGGIW